MHAVLHVHTHIYVRIVPMYIYDTHVRTVPMYMYDTHVRTVPMYMHDTHVRIVRILNVCTGVCVHYVHQHLYRRPSDNTANMFMSWVRVIMVECTHHNTGYHYHDYYDS